ncbi:MAG TPA: hypothetical protein VGP96_10245 [Candidatus Dormibacteraeota bacterium]|jgi:hypothetical protein|nr:hypothetical protein [Candidatus Dormibacteraeota bacterium]
MTQPVPIGPEDAERRIRLRRLDDCLNVLEQAHELDMTLVNEKIADLVTDRVPTIHSGMLIADAIEEVLRHQEPYMLQVRPEVASRRVRRRREPFDIRLLLQRR